MRQLHGVGALVSVLALSISSCGDDGNHPLADAPDVDGPQATAMLAIDPGSALYGSVTVGQTSPGTTFTITNSGTASSGVVGVALGGGDAGEFQLAASGCSGTLAAGASCQIEVVFAPTASGTKGATLDVTASPGGTVSAALDGEGIAVGALTISASTNALGDVVVGKTGATTATFTVQNTGGGATGALGVQLAGSDPGDFAKSADTCAGHVLAAQETCTFVVSFTPQSVGPKSGELRVSGVPGGLVTGVVNGTGLDPARLLASPALLEVGSVALGQTSVPATITVGNVGGVDTETLAVSKSGPDASELALSGTCAGTAVPASGTCTVVVTFTPTSAGAAFATVTIADGAGASVTVGVSGMGLAPGTLVISPSTTVFPPTNVGAVSASKTFTVTNPSGVPTGTLVTSFLGADASQFVRIAAGSTCNGSTLPPGGSCSVTIAFSPTSGGSHVATVQIAGSPGGVVVAGLAGLGVPPARLTIEPQARDFGSVVVGASTTHTFLVRNAGGQASGVPGATLGGTGAAAYSITSNGCTAALGPNASCAVGVRFTPSTAGAAPATLTMSAAPGDDAVANLDGNGIAPGGLVIEPSSYAFANTALGASSAFDFTVRNTGTVTSGSISLAALGVNAVDFSIATNTCTTLAPQATCTFSLRFTPSANGTRTATISATASPGGTATSAVVGNAPPALEIISVGGGPVVDPYSFGPAIINNSVAHDVDITVRNNTASAQALTVSGAFGAPAQFSLLANSCGGTIAGSGGTCMQRVRFAPTTTGAKTGSVTFSITGGQATQNLTGTGTDALTITALAGTDFGAVPLNSTSPALRFRVTNPFGSVTTGALASSLTGTGFAITDDTCDGTTLLAAATCTIDVTFAPSALGPITASLGVAASPGGAPSIALTATGASPTGSAPTDIVLAPSSIAEDASIGSLVGALSAVDADAADTFTYALVGGAGSDDNDAFSIVGAEVRTNGVFDFETKSTFSIRVRVTDSGSQIFETAIAISVTNVDEPPSAVADSASVAEDSGATAIDVLANDTDIDGGPKMIASATQPAHGTVIVTGGGVTYQPSANYFGPDAFSYTLNGGSIATVAVTVIPVDDAPVAVADSAMIGEDAAATAIDVLANDTDIDGGPKAIASATQPAHGTVAVLAAGAGLTYQPAANYTGADSFTYTLDGGSTATVSITVTAMDDPPVATDDFIVLNEDDASFAFVLDNDTDVDGGPKMIVSLTQPAHGTAMINANNSVTYTPEANYFGDDSYTYTLNGGSVSTVTAHVLPVNDAPSFTKGTDRTVLEDAALQTIPNWATGISVGPANEAGQTVAFSITNNTNPALFSTAPAISPAGTLTFRPAANANGSATLTVTLTDSGGTDNGGVDTSAAQTFVINVTAVNDAPSFTAGPNQNANEDAGAQTVDPWATALSAGPANESTQALSFAITNNTNPALFSAGPSVSSTGALTYTPAANANGTTTITLRIVDDGGTANGGVNQSPTQQFTITIDAVDDPPVAVADSATLDEDAAATAIPVLTNDTDIDGGTKSIASTTQPANGTVVITGGGSGLTYRPNGNYCNSVAGTPDTFSYTLTPGTSSTTVSVTVTCVDDAPVANADAATVTEDSTGNAIGVLGNDTDIDAGPKMVASVTQPGNGSVTITGGGTGVSYTPTGNYCNSVSGTPDTFTYTLNGSSSATVSVTVTCVDDAPVAVADAPSAILEDASATAINVLANDTDIDGGAKAVFSVTQPANGTVVITGGGTGVTYAPDANYCNTQSGGSADTFTYTLAPGSSSATVSVTVTCVDDAPVAVADAPGAILEDASPTAIPVLANDTDIDGGPRSIGSTTTPLHGTVVITGGGSGLTYEPDANYCGSDSFDYALAPGGSTATVTISITCVDDAPIADADAALVTEDSGDNTIDVLANDDDIDGGPIAIASNTDPAHGTVTITSGGDDLTYRPDDNYCNTQPGGSADTFQYTLTPGGSTTTVSVLVTCVDDPAVPVNDSVSVAEDSSANAIDVLFNDSDIDGGPRSVASVTNPSHGSATNVGTGVQYTPAANYCGPDSFTYAIVAASPTATVSINVTCANDNPDAMDDSVDTDEDMALTFDPRLNDTISPDVGETLRISAVDSSSTTGSVTFTNTSITYTPPSNFSGTTTLTYTISDRSPTGGLTDTATVTITVHPIDDPPEPNDDGPLTVNENSGTTTFDVLANDFSGGGGDGGLMEIQSVTQPANGDVVITNGGADLTYTPDADYCNDPPGTDLDTFTYTVNGGASATVTVKVTCASTALFDGSSAFPVGRNPWGIAKGDFDSDGDVDLATADRGSSTVSVLLNAGNGTYSLAQSVSVSGDLYDITAGFFDGDAFPDLAVTALSTATVSILKNDGHGAFTVSSTIPVSRGGRVAVGRLNADSIDDLVIAAQGSPVVDILIGNGSGGFARTAVSTCATNRIAIADIDADGDSDFVLTCRNVTSLALFKGAGDGSFSQTTIPAGVVTNSLVIGRFDADAYLDIAISSRNGTSVSILAGDGTGAFTAGASVTVVSAPSAMASGDFDGDSDDDIAVRGRDSGTLQVLTNTGSGAFTVTSTLTAASRGTMIVGHFDTDSNLDVASVQREGNAVSIQLGNGTGSFRGTPTMAVAGQLHAIAAGDLDHDGHADVLITDRANNRVRVLLANGTGGFTIATDVNVGAFPSAVAVGDFDKDGDVDFVATNRNSSTVSIALGDGAGGFAVTGTVSVASTPNSLSVGRVNADAFDDLVVTNPSGTVTVCLGDGVGGFTTTSVTGAGRASGSAIGDFNEDGRADIAVSDRNASNVHVFLQDGSGGFSRTPVAVPGSSLPSDVATSDLDGDGHLDLAITSRSAGGVAVLLGSGAGGFASAPGSPFVTAGQASSIVITQLVGSSAPDIAIADNWGGTVTVLANSGAAQFTAQSYSVGYRSHSLVAVDFNGDGKRDLLATNVAGFVSMLKAN